MARKVTNYFVRNGRYYARITYYDDRGKRRQKARLALSKADVPNVVRQLENELERGGPEIFESDKTTLGEYLDDWQRSSPRSASEHTMTTRTY